MSLLLEALNRSESERLERETRPDLPPVQHSVPGQVYQSSPPSPAAQGTTIINTGNQTPWFLVILCFNALLFVVAGLFWFQLENQKNNNDMLLFSHLLNKSPETSSGQNTPAIDNNLAQLAIAEAESQLNNINGQSREILPREPVALVNADSIHQEYELPTASEVPEQAKTGTAVRSSQPLSADESVEQPQAVHDGTVYQLETLPAELAASFPELAYNAHLYSPDLPSARMIMVNDKKYNEKDLIQEDLYVDQITPQGVIYRYKSVKLRVNIVSELQ